jgi:hypothetical protein
VLIWSAMKIRMLAPLILFAVVALAAEESALPKDVQDYIQSRASCNHLGGEDYSDPSRARMMAKELKECGYEYLIPRSDRVAVSSSSVDTIDMQEKRLRKKYRRQPKVLRAMEEARDQLP